MRRTAIICMSIVLMLVTVLLMNCNSDEDKVEWDKTFSGPDIAWGYCVQQTSDGGYIIAGLLGDRSSSEADVWLIKTDADGNELWDKTFGGSDNDFGYSVQQTSDGGYIVAGRTKSYGAGGDDAWLIKTYPDGTEEWSQTFGGSIDDESWSVQQTSDGGYIIAGIKRTPVVSLADVWLIKTDADGNELWDKTFGGSDDDFGYFVQQTSDEGYILVGRTESYGVGSYDIWLIKTDANGNELWNKTFGGSDRDVGYSVQQTSDGGYIIVGETWSYGTGESDLWLINTDSEGNPQWEKTFGNSSLDIGRSVQQTSDGGYIIAGETSSYGEYYDVWLIKTDSSGNELWNETFGRGNLVYCNCVQQTSDGGYILAGVKIYSGSDFPDIWLIKVKGE